MEEINNIKKTLILHINANIKYISDEQNSYLISQYLTNLIRKISTYYKVYIHFNYKDNILTLYITTEQNQKYTLIVNVNKYMRKEKLKFIL